jgi:hypothetical protein
MADVPAFDPSQPFEPAGSAAPAFDPSKPFESVTDHGALSAGGHGVADTLSFGLHPAMRGLMSAAGESDTAPASIGSMLTGSAHLFHENIVKPLLGQDAAGLSGQVTGDTRGEATKAYARGREAALNDERLAREAHPIAYVSGQLAGALALPGMGAGRGVTAGERITGGLRAGAISGGLYGTGESISKGETLPETALSTGRGALTGAAFGAAGSGAIEALSPLGNRISAAVRGMRNPDDEAARRVAGALTADFTRQGPAFTAEEIAAANAAGTGRSLVDIGGERTRELARSASDTSPEARAALTELTQDRFQSQSPRIAGFIRQITGGGDAAGDLEAIQAAGRRANRPAYAQAYAIGDRPIWSPELERLTASPSILQALRGAQAKWRDWQVLDGFGASNPPVRIAPGGTLQFQPGGLLPFPNIQFWDYAARNIADRAATARRSGATQEAARLGGLERALKTELDTIVPEFGAARRGAASFFGADNALEAGHNFARQGIVEPRQQLMQRQAFSRFSPEERQIFSRGYASNLADMIERSPDNRNVLSAAFVNSGPARDRTLMALGPQNAGQLEALLRAERIVDRARTNMGNSRTAQYLSALGMAGGTAGATAGAEALVNQDFNPAHVLTAAIGVGLARRGAQVIDQRVARRVGEMLASDDPAILARGAQVAARTPWIVNALRYVTGGAGRGATAAVQPLGNQGQKPQRGPPGFGRGGVVRNAAGGKKREESYAQWRERIGWANGGRVNAANIDPNPTKAQKEAGNYAKDHVRIHGLDLTIENAKGSYRTGVDKGGKPWRVSMPAHYGYFKRTEGKDGDHVDCYLGPHVKSPHVFVVDQINADTGRFDEHKCFLGFTSKSAAINTYHKAFSGGRAGERFGHITEMTIDEFKHWLEHSDTTKPLRFRQARAFGGRIRSYADGGDVDDDAGGPILSGDIAAARQRLQSGDRLPSTAEHHRRRADRAYGRRASPGICPARH